MISDITGSTYITSGALLPGQFFSFPFMFKSAKAGIFTEKWLLCTGPLLAGGRPISIVLKGIACQEDQHEEKRKKVDVGMHILFTINDLHTTIQVKLNHRQATRIAQQVVKRLVNSIRTPPVTPPPVMPSTMVCYLKSARDITILFCHAGRRYFCHRKSRSKGIKSRIFLL